MLPVAGAVSIVGRVISHNDEQELPGWPCAFLSTTKWFQQQIDSSVASCFYPSVSRLLKI